MATNMVKETPAVAVASTSGATAGKPESAPAKIRKSSNSHLTAEDWERAALRIITTKGVKALAVEPLARSLGVSKGSFYWHFRSRKALLRSALLRWEREESQEFIRTLESVDDPRERLRQLILQVSKGSWNCSLHSNLSAAADHHTVRPILRRVTGRRIEYVRKCYLDLGLSDRAAQHRAALAYTLYVGYIHLNREAPGYVPGSRVTDAYLFHVLRTMIPQDGVRKRTKKP
jgi:AcrR family transcriptional regulator